MIIFSNDPRLIRWSIEISRGMINDQLIKVGVNRHRISFILYIGAAQEVSNGVRRSFGRLICPLVIFLQMMTTELTKATV